jgi:hypothetical protein
LKFITNHVNQTYLRDILPVITEDLVVDFVLAAIAYGNSAADETKDLVGHAVKNKLRLDIWMRYDHTVPVALSLLRRLLKHQRDNIFARFVPDCFHAKVIWWKGYGAYIGSANHTDRGWLTNIEAGVFIEEDELAASGMDKQLEEFFEYLHDLNETIPISEEYLEEMVRLVGLNKNVYELSRKARAYPIWRGPTFVARQKSFDRRKESFRKEWSDALGYLKNIEQQLPAYMPPWLSDDVPVAWQTDQFLHAYYYNRVGDGLHKPFEDFFNRNAKDPSKALHEQLEWWRDQNSAPSGEDTNLLRKEVVLDLTVEDLESVFKKTHATRDHVIKVPMSVLGRPDVKSMDREGRLKLFAKLIMTERNQKGWDVRQLLHYVLYGGDDKDIWQRLYHAGRDAEYGIPRYGLNSIAEVIGWARPELMPPRNGRTSKALRALGFPVKIY